MSFNISVAIALRVVGVKTCVSRFIHVWQWQSKDKRGRNILVPRELRRFIFVVVGVGLWRSLFVVNEVSICYPHDATLTQDARQSEVALGWQAGTRLSGDDVRSPRVRAPEKPNGVEVSEQLQYTRQETRNLGLKAITDKSGPVTIRFEFGYRETLMPLGDHAAHWANYLRELVREFLAPCTTLSWVKYGGAEGGGLGSEWDPDFDMRHLPRDPITGTYLCGHTRNNIYKGNSNGK
ncbi:hypothetical protein Tco_0644111 [Tanacetum coccineum]